MSRTSGRSLWLLLVAVVATMSIAVPASATAAAPAASSVVAVADSATVSGSVTTSGSGAPIAGAWIAFLRARDLTLAAQSVANGDGVYTAEVKAGEYFLYLIDPAGSHATGFWGAPDAIRVVAGQAATADPTMNLSTGSVSGVVSDDVSGSPIAGAWAIALSAGGAPEVAARTDASGRFTLAGLRVGPHRIAYLDPTGTHISEFYPDARDAISSSEVIVATGADTTANVSLARQSLGPAFLALRGTVTESVSGTALPGVIVIAQRASDYRLAGAALTSASGRYRVNVSSGSYVLAFLDPTGRHEMEWHADQPYNSMGAAAPVSAPSTTDATLNPTTGSLGGTVVDDPTGDPIKDAWVLAIGSTGQIRGTRTEADGDFSMSGLPVGTYRAAVVDAVGGRLLEYWDDSSDYEGAEAFVVTPSSAPQVVAGLSAPPPPGLMESTVGWWDVSTGLLPNGDLPDLSGNGNDLILRPGVAPAVGPALVTPDPVRGRNLFSPGWDDMYLDTPAPATDIAGIDVSWEGDLGRVLAISSGELVNWIAHQGSTTNGTFAWAVGIVIETGQVIVARSGDGTNVTTVTSSAAFPAGPQRGAVTVDAVSGELRLYRQAFGAPVEAFDLPYTDASWELIDTVQGGGPLALYDSAAPIRHSSSMQLDAVDWDFAEGWFKALYRLRVRDQATGVDAAYLDVDQIPEEPTWGIETALPPVGSVTKAKVTDFAGRVGETWTIHNYMTTSYPIVIVDHPSLVFGNGSYAEAPAVDGAWNLSDSSDLSVWVVYGTTRVGGHSTLFPLVARRDRAYPAPGWQLSGVTNDDVGARGIVADGSALGWSNPPPVREGATTISGFQVDRATDTIESFTDGISLGAPSDIGELGSLSNPDAPLRVASFSDDGHGSGSFAFMGLAIFDRTLTPEEIARLPYEFGLVAAPPG